jgi:hypothetical protein
LGVHVLDQWAQEGLIADQSGMMGQGLDTYGDFYAAAESEGD